MSEKEQDRGHTQEEADLLSRSTKKMEWLAVRLSTDFDTPVDIDMEEMELESPNVPETAPLISTALLGAGRTISYRDTLQQNNPNLILRPLKIRSGRRRGS